MDVPRACGRRGRKTIISYWADSNRPCDPQRGGLRRDGTECITRLQGCDVVGISRGNPIITWTTDFGPASPYVAQMKGVVLQLQPRAHLIDLTHAIAPQSIHEAAFVLSSCWRYFPQGTVHVAVVDPGVGTDRRILLAELDGQFFIAPDNGLLALVRRQADSAKLWGVSRREYWLAEVSATFHGRDIMAPLAGHLTLGVAPQELGEPADRMVELDWPQPRVGSGYVEGQVVYVDSFGNLISNIDRSWLATAAPAGRVQVRLGQLRIDQIVRTYADGPPGAAVALFGSMDLLEIAIVNGSASRVLQAGPRTPIRVEW